jgi:hypothetical protein
MARTDDAGAFVVAGTCFASAFLAGPRVTVRPTAPVDWSGRVGSYESPAFTQRRRPSTSRSRDGRRILPDAVRSHSRRM